MRVEGEAGRRVFDGDGLQEMTAGVVGGQGGQGVGGGDALEDFFLEARLGLGDEIAAEGGEDNPDDPSDGTADDGVFEDIPETHDAPCVAVEVGGAHWV